MKKFFTFVVAAFAALTMNAAVEVGNDTFTFGTPISLNGGYDGKYHNLNESMNFDASDYDYIWVQFKDATGKIGFNLVYSEWLKKEAWGDVYETKQQVIEGITSGVVGIAIDKTSTYANGDVDGNFTGDTYDKHLRQVCLQDQGVASTITVVGVWLGTKAEFEEALAGNKPQVNPIKELDPAGATGGWGDKTFDKITQTGTITAKDAAVGWWLGGTDASNYDNFVLELENVAIPETLDAKGEPNNYLQAYVQYDGNVTENAPVTEGNVIVVVPLNAEKKAKVMQLGLQGSAGASFVVKKAYFATADKTPSTGISSAVVASKANPKAPIYNLAGQKVSKSYKGVVIQNGKKFVQ